MTHQSNYVQAKMAFYHDSVGSRAHNEVFEVKNTQVLSDLEQRGYVQKVESEQLQKMQQLQQEVGQRQALTNEAVSMAHHVQNVQANKHHETVKQMRQQQAQNTSSPTQEQQNQAAQDTKATAAKKANEK